MFPDGLVIGQAGTTHGIGSDVNLGLGNDLHINNAVQVRDIGCHIVVLMNVLCLQRLLYSDSLNRFQLVFKDLVGSILDQVSHISIRRASVGRIVFESSVRGRVMGRSNDYAVTERFIRPVAGQDGVGDNRSRGITVILCNTHRNSIGGKYLQGGQLGRPGQSMGIHTHEQGSADPLIPAVITDRLGYGQDMGFVKTTFQRAAPMS